MGKTILKRVFNIQIHNIADYYRNHYCNSINNFTQKERNVSLRKENMTYEQIYNLGVQAGIKMMENKIERQCEREKPVLANGELYFFKDARQNLIDIMDDLDEEYGVEKKKNYIVPMRKVIDGKSEEVKIIISAKTPFEAWCGAIYNFGEESGWHVYSKYNEYEQL